MGYFELNGALSGATETLISGVSDLHLRTVGGKLLLQATARGEAAAVVWDVSGTPVLRTQHSLPSGSALSAPLEMTAGSLDGNELTWVSGMAGQGVRAYSLNSAGAMGHVVRVGTGATPLVDVEVMTLAGETLVLTAARGAPELRAWKRDASGDFVQVQSLSVGAGGGDTLALKGVTVGGADYLLALSAQDAKLSLFSVDAGGTLALAGRVGTEGGLSIATPTQLCTVEMDGATYAIIGSAGSSSVSVVEVGGDGTLTVTDQINDDLNSRFAGVTAMEVVEVGERVFIIAAGSDAGMTLMTLLPGGRLLGLETIVHTEQNGLGQPVAMTAATLENGEIRLYSSGEDSSSPVGWSIETDVGVVLEGGAGSDDLDGTAADDLLSGGAGDDNINGGAGRDILIDGAGDDLLYGGAGADVFVLAPDGIRDRVMDFEIGIDRLDLSAYGRIYSLDAIDFQPLSNGMRLTINGERIDLLTPDRVPLAVGEFDLNDLIDLWHIDVSWAAALVQIGGTGGADTLEGGDGAELIEGFAGNDALSGGLGSDTLDGGDGGDTLAGGGGDDTLRGGAGADWLDGGAGIDTADYSDSTGSLRVDLMLPQVNTNIAAGDSFELIENLLGSQGRDNLRGDGGDNHILGMANVDYLVGRRGDDTLEGGIGNDTLIGGLGADLLIGGAHRDRAQYSMSQEGVVVDLADTANNTGEAAGDTFVEIEDLAGSDHGDALYGDGADNRLIGRDGDDILAGRGGDDMLYGGAGRDVLQGGAGDDVLSGGVHADTFVFSAGHDEIADLRLAQGDTIGLEQALFGALTGAEVLDLFGSVEGGDYVLRFSAVDSLTLRGIDTGDGLAEALFVV